MKEKNILLVKFLLTIDAIAFGVIGSYLVVDNVMYKIALGAAWIGAIVFKDLLPVIQVLRIKKSELIFGGVRYRLPVIITGVLGLAFVYMVIQRNEIGYVFFTLAFFVMAINEGFHVIVFNYDQHVVTGLIDDENCDVFRLVITPQADGLKVSYNEKIFEYNRSRFSDENWNRLLSNLQRIKNGPGGAR